MALADTPIGVSMTCPALVATGMSSEGANPDNIAAQALATIEDGTFAVIPDEGSTPSSPLLHGSPPVNVRMHRPRQQLTR